MKILKAPAGFEPFQVACAECYAELEIESTDDLVRIQGGDFRESWDYLAFRCAHCGCQNNMHSKKIPSYLLKKVKTEDC